MDQAIASEGVSVALNVGVESGGLERRGGVLIMPVNNVRTGGAMEVRVVHGNLSEVRVCRTTERVWENEMEEDSLCWNQAFGSVDGGRVASTRHCRACEEVKKREGISRVSGQGGRGSSNNGFGQRLDHFGGEPIGC